MNYYAYVLKGFWIKFALSKESITVQTLFDLSFKSIISFGFIIYIFIIFLLKIF